MTAFDQLVTSLVTGGMEPGAAASLVARAVIEAVAATKSSGAARTARWRERHRTSQNVTGTSPLSAVTVTSQPSQSVTCDGHPSESAPAILTTLLPSDSSLGSKKRSSEPRARGKRLPDDWQPSEADIKFAADRGMRLTEIEIEATKFRNYWTNRTDKQACKPRWDRAWQNWILNVRGAPNAVRPNESPARAEFRDALAELKNFNRGTEGSSGSGGEVVRLLRSPGGG